MDDKENRTTQVAEPAADPRPAEDLQTGAALKPDTATPVEPDRTLMVETEPLTASAPQTPTESPEPGLRFVAAIEPAAAPAEEPALEATPTLDRIVEALLFAATSPVPEPRLRDIATCSAEELSVAIERLNGEYAADSRAFRIHRIAQGYQLYTLPEYSAWVGKLLRSQRVQRLSRASLETLSIIAYKQPVTKPEIEQFRGVDSTAPLLTLLERKLVVLAGRAHKPGNPFLYRTSKEFLRYFGLATLDDLPRREELEEFLRHRDLGDADEENDQGENAGVNVPPRPGPSPDFEAGPQDNVPEPPVFQSDE